MIEVSVIIPVLDEEKYIIGCLNSVLSQDYPRQKMEVLFVDGLSADRTREIISEYADKYEFIHLLDNKKRIIPCALNIGIVSASGKYIVRMDAHTEYADNYISKCIEILKRTCAENVGGPVRARGKTKKQKAVAAAYHSKFALGSGGQYQEDYEGFVDTVFLGAYKKELVEKIGMYDEAMPRNEDDEFNMRIIKNGGRIYMSPTIQTIYYPRDSYIKLFWQYFGYGEGKIDVIRKHGRSTRLRQMIPLLFVLFLICGGISSLLFPVLRRIYIGIIGVYIFLDAFASVKNPYAIGMAEKLSLFWVHIVIHIAYGLGCNKGVWNNRRLKRL